MNCPNCGCEKSQKIKPYSGVHPIFQRMSLIECDKCSLVFSAPQPSDDELKQYYSSYWNGNVAISTASTRRYYFAQSVSRIHYLTEYIKKGSLSILDVGAGLGLFEKGLRHCELQNIYVAIEPDDQQFETLRAKLGIKNVFLHVNDLPKGSQFDLIVLAHVLEHVKDPHVFVDSLMPFLSPGGLLFVEVPNSDYRYKDNMESHLLFFNPKSLGDTLEQHGVVLDVSTVGKMARNLRIKDAMPQHGLLQFAKELVKNVIAFITPNLLGKDIFRYEMSQYGDDRQWLRAVLRKND